MYFCYVDESGDPGSYDSEKPEKTGTKYFILSGIIVSAARWRISLDTLKSFRKKIAREGYLPYDIEFHCAEMIDPHKIKEFTNISVKDRWALIEAFAEIIGNQAGFSLLTIVLDKTQTKLRQDEYLTTSITKIYQAFDEFLKDKKEQGLILFDKANEKNITTHVRKLLGTGASGETVPEVRIGWVVEDPIFRVSSDSFFVQSADLVAYTLKEQEFPSGSRKKFNADRIFRKQLKNACFKSTIADEEGIVRI
jgi:hypothetical protein